MDTNLIIIAATLVFAILIIAILEVMFLKDLSSSVKKYWLQIEKKLNKRHSLIPFFVETIRKSADTDYEAVGKLLENRLRAAKEYHPGAKKIEYEMDLTDSINQVVEASNAIQTLSKDVQYLQVRKEIDDLEKSIDSLSNEYNERVRKYNSSIHKWFLIPAAKMLRMNDVNIFEFEI